MVLFSHHAPESLTADAPDELAPLCLLPDSHGHDINPGCDLDPRNSSPIHLQADAVNLLHEFPNAIAWVAGHSHDNLVNAFPKPGGGGGFWSIRVAAEADWPQQSRLLEVFDNHDGTLSIFGTILDQVGQSVAPAPGTAASAMDFNDLASAARTMSFNDLQSGAPLGEGAGRRPQRRAADRRPALIACAPCARWTSLAGSRSSAPGAAARTRPSLCTSPPRPGRSRGSWSR